MAKPATTVSTDESVQGQAPRKQLGPVFKAAAGPTKWVDERIGVAGLGRPFLRKVFPDHWSFLLGEIALYSFIVCLLSGVFLTIWFVPSMAEVEYEGSYQLLRGAADVRGVRVDPQLVLRHPRRAAAAADAPLGRDALHGRNAHPQPAHLLHRRIPEAARAQLADRGQPGRPRPGGRLRGLLAAGRLALGHWSAVRRRPDPVHPADRHLGRVLRVRRRVPRRADRGPALHGPHPVAPGHHPRADRGPPGAGGLPQAHPVPRSRAGPKATWSVTRCSRCTRPRPVASSSSSSASSP